MYFSLAVTTLYTDILFSAVRTFSWAVKNKT